MLLWLVSVAEMKELTNSVRLITKDPDMFFCGADHRSRFAKLQKKEIIHSGSTASFAASLYLLTASSFLWNEISPAVCDGRIYFKSFKLGKLAKGDWQTYTLYKMAKEIYTGNGEVTFMELCDRKIIGDKLIRLIINALLIRRYGLETVRIE